MKYESIEFNAVKQEYSEYEIENGLRLKVMLTIVNITNEGNTSEAEKGRVMTAPVSAVIAPPDFDRSYLKELLVP